jgi:hypothetical protein
MNVAAVVVELRVQPDGALEVNQIGPTEWCVFFNHEVH